MLLVFRLRPIGRVVPVFPPELGPALGRQKPPVAPLGRLIHLVVLFGPGLGLRHDVLPVVDKTEFVRSDYV